MFSGLTDLAMRRTPLQALGFYLAYSFGLVIVLAILGAVVGTVAGLVFGDVAMAVNKAMTAFGAISAIVLCGVLATTIARKRNLLSGINLVLLVLSWTGPFLGVFSGMAPVAILAAPRSEELITSAVVLRPGVVSSQADQLLMAGWQEIVQCA